MKYRVRIRYERVQDIVVDAKNAKEARHAVNEGEFEDKNIVDTQDNSVEVFSVEREA